MRAFLGWRLSSILTGLLLVALPASHSPAADIVRIFVGGPAVLKLVNSLKDKVRDATGVTIEVQMGDSRESAAFLVTGKIEMISSAATIEETLGAVNPKVFGSDKFSNYESFELMRTEIYIGVHPDNTITNFTDAQIMSILKGEAKSWKSLSGQDVPLVFWQMKNTFGMTRELQKKYLAGKPLTTDQLVVDQDGLMRQMQREKGAVGFFSGTQETPTFKPKYFKTGISYPLRMIMKREGPAPARKVFDFLQSDVTQRLKQ